VEKYHIDQQFLICCHDEKLWACLLETLAQAVGIQNRHLGALPGAGSFFKAQSKQLLYPCQAHRSELLPPIIEEYS